MNTKYVCKVQKHLNLKIQVNLFTGNTVGAANAMINEFTNFNFSIVHLLIKFLCNCLRIIRLMLCAILHEFLQPIIYFFLCQYAVVVCVSFFYHLIDVYIGNLFGLSANFCGESFFMDIENHTDEALSLILLELSTLVRVVLRPNLIDDMLNDQFILRLLNVFLNETCCIYSLLIWLTDEDAEQDCREEFCTNVLDRSAIFALLVKDFHGVSVFHELFVRTS